MKFNRNHQHSTTIPMATDPTISFIAGGLAGGIATIATSPLEVIKTRLQSNVGQEVMKYRLVPGNILNTSPYHVCQQHHNGIVAGPRFFNYARYVIRTEGSMALFKGLTLSLLGSMPTRAIYFTLYSNFKLFFKNFMTHNSNQIHFISAMSAGITTSTITSPIWVVKTHLQLDNRPNQLLGFRQCIQMLYSKDGVRGFYRGLSASYAGSIETAIHFVIYERMKEWINVDKDVPPFQCMLVAACSKITASTLCYPHEVCRTRMRQSVEPSLRKYNSFFQTLLTIWKEEGARGLYGGMAAHQLRVVPNSAIIFFAYEAIVRTLGYMTL